jgi:hypothetical protein
MDEPAESRPPPVSKLSKTPSWIMLGFVLGALFVWSLEREQEPAATPVLEQEKPPAPVPPPAPPRLMAIEAVFAEAGGDAVWENDTTEVALWNPETKKYSDFFEVLRSGDNLYFRSIPHLTHPILTHGVKENSLLQFTETPAHRAAWLRDVRDENWRTFTGGNRDDLKPAAPGTPPARTAPALPVTPAMPPGPAPTAPPPRTGSGDGKP